MDAIRIIQDEHRALAAVLHGMRYLVREIRERGAGPMFDVLGAMVYYIDAFPERVHHPRETAYLFHFLRERCADAVPLLDALEAEHRDGAVRVRALEQALTRYQQGGAAEFAPFADAVESYADFQYEHMGREEREVIPLARQHLRPSDWEIIDAAFAGGSLPLAGDGTVRDYDKLFERIVRLAPPPIGVGPEAPRPAR
ncbi:MAG TPA: hemerythrin domain-containing protein [Casimicrobiaceae bacterium]